MDEQEFRRRADAALEELKRSLYEAEGEADFEVEENSGALHISFDEPPAILISPNAPVRQIWISALSTSFKLDWSGHKSEFILAKSGESLKPLIGRLINRATRRRGDHADIGGFIQRCHVAFGMDLPEPFVVRAGWRTARETAP